jgi:hypothetical protein
MLMGSAPDDVERLMRALDALRCHGLHQWAITGGVATAAHLNARANRRIDRPLNDLDIVIPLRSSIPELVAKSYLISHIHPYAKPGRMRIQIVDPDLALRIDIFSPFGAALDRKLQVNLETFSIPVLSLEDLASRLASLLMDLVHGEPVPAKHARDLLQLRQFVDPEQVERIWADYRRSWHPITYEQASSLTLELSRSRANLLIDPVYSSDVSAVCPSCHEIGPFRLAPRQTIRSVLGYC